MLEMADLNPVMDFMDVISDDIPKGKQCSILMTVLVKYENIIVARCMRVTHVPK